MGFETFRVELSAGQASCRDAHEVVRQLPHTRPNPESLPLRGSTCYLIENGQHVFEVEVTEAPVKMSCRFTLCHPPSVDVAFLGLLRELMVRLGMAATIRDDVRPEHARSFSLNEFPEFAAVMSQYIAPRRAEWIAAFGDEPMAATTNEVYERVILPQCEPESRQPT